MTTLREAAQQALEALNGVLDAYGEPVYELSISGGLFEAVECRDAITALRAALEQPEQEPVAWICTDDEMRHRDPRWGRIKWIDASSEDELAGNFLYTTPPRREWQGLTDEEVMQMTRAECVDMRWPSTALNIARAIEQALREKNHG